MKVGIENRLVEATEKSEKNVRSEKYKMGHAINGKTINVANPMNHTDENKFRKMPLV